MAKCKNESSCAFPLVALRGFHQPSKSSDSSSSESSSTVGFGARVAGFFSRLCPDPSGEGSVDFCGSMMAVKVCVVRVSRSRGTEGWSGVGLCLISEVSFNSHQLSLGPAAGRVSQTLQYGLLYSFHP